MAQPRSSLLPWAVLHESEGEAIFAVGWASRNVREEHVLYIKCSIFVVY